MTYTVTNTFVPGGLTRATEVNTNFTQAAVAISSTSDGHDHDGTDSKYLNMATCFATHPLRIKTSSYTTSSTYTNGGSITSFNFTHPANSLLVNALIKATLQSGASTVNSGIRVMVSGATLGSYYINSLQSSYDPGATGYDAPIGVFYWGTSAGSVLYTDRNSAQNLGVIAMEPLTLPDTTTTITFIGDGDNGTLSRVDSKLLYFTSFGTD